MAEQSGFFDAHVMNGEYDRVYLSEHFAKYFASFIGNGVFGGKSNELMVSQNINSGMKVDVLSGMSWINGFWYENTSNLTLDISVADGVLNRIDNVVVRWGKIERSIWITIVKGTPATNAVAPSIERSSDYYDLKLAEISVKAGATNITQADITDTRLNSDVCGFVVGVVQQFDTTEFGNQLDGYISKYAAEYKAFLEGLELTGTNEVNSLIDRLNAIVKDESAFANLVLKVDDVESELASHTHTPASIGAMGIGTDNGAVGAKYTTTIEPDTADNAASIIRIKENATGNTRVLIAANTAENNNEVSQIVLRDGTNVGKVNIQCNTSGAKGIRITDANGVERVKLHHTTVGDECVFQINDASGNDITLYTIGAQERFLCGRNKTIATSAWASDTTYADYPYRASVALPPITAVSFVEIVFSPVDATSGNFAPVCDTYNGGIYVYAKAVPDAAITIPTIIVWR